MNDPMEPFRKYLDIINTIDKISAQNLFGRNNSVLNSIIKTTDQLDSINRYAKLARQFESNFADTITKIIGQYDAHIKNIEAAIKGSPFLDSAFRFANDFDVSTRQRELLKAAGWLPHPTTPFQLLTQFEGDPSGLDDAIGSYYTENWDQIGSHVKERTEAFLVDDEAKLSIKESVDAFSFNLYRLICRNIFPEIERVIRVELNENSLAKPSKDGRKKKLEDLLADQIGSMIPTS